MHRAIIAIGTNLGDKEENIKKAIEMMKQRGIRIVKSAGVYRTKPYGYTNQPDFLNSAAEIETMLSPEELIETLLSIEKDMGRVRKVHWGPRIIDLDIIFFDNLTVDKENLKIPHPDMQNRLFVLKPVSEIAPCRVHPIFCKTVKTLLEELLNAEKTS